MVKYEFPLTHNVNMDETVTSTVRYPGLILGRTKGGFIISLKQGKNLTVKRTANLNVGFNPPMFSFPLL
jgi:hypothetical protein